MALMDAPLDSFNVACRTRKNFADNLKIIMNINAAFASVLDEMRGRIAKIGGNLGDVKRNLEFMEFSYEGIFRKVNRLIVSPRKVRKIAHKHEESA